MIETARITMATATRCGNTSPLNADAAAIHHVPGTSTLAAGLADGMGHDPETVSTARHAAETMARAGGRCGSWLGVEAAATQIKPGGEKPTPYDAVGICAVATSDGRTSISGVGDCRAFGYRHGQHLEQLTTDRTMAAFLNSTGLAPEITTPFDAWPQTSLAVSHPLIIPRVDVDHPLIILTTDGIKGSVPAVEIFEVFSKFSK